MSFLDLFFRRTKQNENTDDNWEKLIYARSDVDFRVEEQRTQYIMSCLEQMAEATREINLLTEEYSRVTTKLTDIEEIEALPEIEKINLMDIAKRYMTYEKECERFQGKKNRMGDSDYNFMRKREDEVQEGIEKLRESEHYAGLIKQDLQRLDKERHAYAYRRNDLETALNNYRGMAIIFVVAFVLCLVLLLVLQLVFEMDTKIGYLLAAGAAAIAVAVIMIRYTDREKELNRVEHGINKLIQLQNTVKIRYVNNNQLLEYLRMKYNVENAKELEQKWQLYQQEKEERREFAEAEAKVEYYQKQIVQKLNNFHISDPEHWAKQPQALIDKREVVEMRHALILQRQSLRKQMDYNTDLATTAKEEIKDVVEKYPVYANEILTMVEKYEGDY